MTAATPAANDSIHHDADADAHVTIPTGDRDHRPIDPRRARRLGSGQRVNTPLTTAIATADRSSSRLAAGAGSEQYSWRREPRSWRRPHGAGARAMA